MYYQLLGLKLNVDKCVAIIIGKCIGEVKNLLLYGNIFKWDTELRYLGIMFKADVKLKVDLTERSRKFIGSVASVLRGRVMGEENVYVHVIKTKCMPLLFYGIDCLKLDSACMQKLTVVYNTAFRWVLGVSKREYMRVYLRKCGTMSFKYLVDLRFLLFVYKMSTNCTKLLGKLLIWYKCTYEMKDIMLKYKLWNGCTMYEINRAITNAFNNYCDVV